MNIVKKHLRELLPADYNPRKQLRPGDPEYEKLKRSINTFGYVEPIIYNKRNGVVVGGHQRLSVLKDLGFEEVECVEVDLDEVTEKSLNVALNKISGSWDEVKLAEVFETLKGFDADLELTGFDVGEIDLMLNIEPEPIDDGSSKKKDASKDYDDSIDKIEELKDKIEKCTVKMGDLYKLGNHYLLCGDATSERDVKALLSDMNPVLCLTDPPYGIDIVTGKKGGTIGTVGGSSGSAKEKYKNIKVTPYVAIKNDNSTKTAKRHYEIIKDLSDNQVFFGGNYFTDFLPPSMCWLVWYKHNESDFADFEMAWTSFSKAAKLYDWPWAGFTRKGSKKDELSKRVHPTQKPVGLIELILKDFTDEGDTVVDCFGGSGSTLIACEKANRTCYMMEYENYYIDVIIQRWEKYTGKKAEYIRNIRENS